MLRHEGIANALYGRLAQRIGARLREQGVDIEEAELVAVLREEFAAVADELMPELEQLVREGAERGHAAAGRSLALLQRLQDRPFPSRSGSTRLRLLP